MHDDFLWVARPSYHYEEYYYNLYKKSLMRIYIENIFYNNWQYLWSKYSQLNVLWVQLKIRENRFFKWHHPEKFILCLFIKSGPRCVLNNFVSKKIRRVICSMVRRYGQGKNLHISLIKKHSKKRHDKTPQTFSLWPHMHAYRVIIFKSYIYRSSNPHNNQPIKHTLESRARVKCAAHISSLHDITLKHHQLLNTKNYAWNPCYKRLLIS